jgi:hypothetical protein
MFTQGFRDQFFFVKLLWVPCLNNNKDLVVVVVVVVVVVSWFSEVFAIRNIMPKYESFIWEWAGRD